MGKTKAILEEDMMLHPELYNGHAEEESGYNVVKKNFLKEKVDQQSN